MSYTVYKVFWFFGNMNERVVLYFQSHPITPVTKVDFLWFPTTNLFVAFIDNFLADQNVMCCVRVYKAFKFSDKTLTRPLPWYLNLNWIINICTDDWQGRSKTMRCNLDWVWSRRQERLVSSSTSVLSVWVRLLCITFNLNWKN